MSTMDDVPSHWISKASIAKRIGISRVTVDKQLIRIEKDKELSGRLNVLVVDEGKRKLYFYDPSDVDAVFSELQKKSRRKSSGVKRTNSRVNDNVKLLDDAIVKLELQKEELKVIALEKEVARLEDNLKDLRGENTFLKAQLTDQRPNSASTSPEATEEAVVPRKQSTIAEIKEAVADADKSNVGPTDVAPEEQPELPPEEDTQPIEEAPEEKEARRDNIAPKAEPQQYEKPKGLWAWLKGY